MTTHIEVVNANEITHIRVACANCTAAYEVPLQHEGRLKPGKCLHCDEPLFDIPGVEHSVGALLHAIRSLVSKADVRFVVSRIMQQGTEGGRNR